MTRLPRPLAVLWEALMGFNRNDGSAMAGYIAFTGLLSLFPFLIFAATLIGIMVGDDQVDQIIDALFGIAPEHVAKTIEPVVKEVLNKQSSEVLTLSALFAVYVASNAIEALRYAFDRAYQVDDPRGIIANRFMAIGLVFIGAIVSALLGISILFSPILFSLFERYTGVPLPPSAGYISYGLGIVVFMGYLFMMHWALPGRKMRGTRMVPGVLVTTVIWIIAALGFSIYLSMTPTYTVTYGTLAGVIITLMFFYLTGATIIYGAEVNAAIDRMVRQHNARAYGIA